MSEAADVTLGCGEPAATELPLEADGDPCGKHHKRHQSKSY